MADPVVVTHTSVRKLAALFRAWAIDVDEMIYDLNRLSILPGYLANEATFLKARFKERSDNFITYLTSLRTSLNNVAVELDHIANKYETTADLSKDDIKRVDDLIKSIKITYPDLNPYPDK